MERRVASEQMLAALESDADPQGHGGTPTQPAFIYSHPVLLSRCSVAVAAGKCHSACPACVVAWLRSERVSAGGERVHLPVWNLEQEIIEATRCRSDF